MTTYKLMYNDVEVARARQPYILSFLIEALSKGARLDFDTKSKFRILQVIRGDKHDKQ